MLKKTAISAATLLLAISAQAAEPSTQTRSMAFEDCLKVIAGTASDVGATPINVVETRDLRIVRFPLREGSILITCSRADRRMAITHNPQR